MRTLQIDTSVHFNAYTLTHPSSENILDLRIGQYFPLNTLYFRIFRLTWVCYLEIFQRLDCDKVCVGVEATKLIQQQEPEYLREV